MKDFRPKAVDLRPPVSKPRRRRSIYEPKPHKPFTETEMQIIRYKIYNLFRVMDVIEDWYSKQDNIETLETLRKKKGSV